MSRRREAASDEVLDRNRLIRARLEQAGQHQPQQQVLASFASVLHSSSLGARAQDALLDSICTTTTKYKSILRKMHKARAAEKVFQAKHAAGQHPFPAAATRLLIQPATLHAATDAECKAALNDLWEHFLHDAASLVAQHKAAAVTALQAEATQLKTVTGDAELTTAFNAVLATSTHAQDAAVQEMLLHGKQLLGLELSNV